MPRGLPRGFFTVSYWHETKKLKFVHRYDEVPEELFPVLLGVCRFKSDNEMVIDVRSYERAWRLLLFMDRNVSRKFMEVTDIATYNRIIKRHVGGAELEEVMAWDFDALFSPDTMEIVSASDIPEDDFNEEDADALAASIKEKLHEPIPVARKAPVYFYEDGIMDLKGRLMMQMIAAQIASIKGYDCTYADIADEMEKELAALEELDTV
jgi:hypothetical protein